MSLINDALKKAQRQRNEDPSAATTPTPGGGVRIAQRGQAKSANMMVLIGSGALVLVVLSVVATVYLVNRPAKSAAPKSITATATPKSDAAATAQAPVTVPIPTPSVPAGAGEKNGPAPTAGLDTKVATSSPTSEPIPTAPAPSPGTAPSSTPPVANSTPTSTPSAPTTTAAAPAATATPPEPAAPATPAPAKPDDRVTAFVDAIRVTAIRPVGNESRVLMNDRVYRVNDIVERNLGVKLVKVATDSLTFSDPNGITYVKYF